MITNEVRIIISEYYPIWPEGTSESARLTYLENWFLNELVPKDQLAISQAVGDSTSLLDGIVTELIEFIQIVEEESMQRGRHRPRRSPLALKPHQST